MNTLKHYLVYLITNTVNGKIYIGKHETYDPEDDYMGSGTHLKRAQAKYGLDKFTKTILADFDEPWSMNNMEALVVDEEFITRSDTYNVVPGGIGGSEPLSVKAAKLGITPHEYCVQRGKDSWNSLSEDKKYRAMLNLKKGRNGGAWTGKHHTEDQLQHQREILKIIKHQQGSKNSQYGKHWWKDPNDKTKSMSIKEGDSVPEGWVRGRWCF